MGDSFTFGWGVSDHQTWANHVAEALPTVEFANTGKVNYNITNIRKTLDGYPSNGYIYLIFDNDAELNEQFDFEVGGYLSGITAYIFFATFYTGVDVGEDVYSEDPTVPMMATYFREIEALAERDDTLIFALTDHPLSQDTIDRHPSVIPLHYNVRDYAISFADNHSTPHGNEEIARRMLPHVRPFIDGICQA